MNRFLTIEDVLEIDNVEGWKPSLVPDGVVEWSNGYDHKIFATPGWKRESEVPFTTYSDEIGEVETVAVLQLQENTSVNLQLENYIKTLKRIIKQVS